MEPAVIVHGGVGQPSSHSDGTNEAARKAMDILKGGGDALEAVVKAVIHLEDDERFNAGTGSRLRLDGTLEMDAAVMDSRGRMGAVAAINSVKNPVLVARKVAESPHRVLAGEGAVAFARRFDYPHYDPITEKNKERLVRYKERLSKDDMPEWLGNWTPYRDLVHDTVGAIAVDRRGVFAAACSSGGTGIQLPGRVGDTPLFGAGLWVEKNGGVMSTGLGEAIIEKMLSYRVYSGMMERSPKEMADWGITLFPEEIPVGIITISETGWGLSANKHMAITVMTWDRTLNGNEIWPPEEVEEEEMRTESGTMPAATGSAAGQVPATHEGQKEAQKAVQDLLKPEEPTPTEGTPPAPAPEKSPEEPTPTEGTPPAPAPEKAPEEPPPTEGTPPAPAPEKPPEEPSHQKFRCPYCNKIFAVAAQDKPIHVMCPHCSEKVMIQ